MTHRSIFSQRINDIASDPANVYHDDYWAKSDKKNHSIQPKSLNGKAIVIAALIVGMAFLGLCIHIWNLLP